MAITASMVGELRAKTDAPMMECKKALTEAEGDMAKASPRVELPSLESPEDEIPFTAMEGVIREERGLVFEREDSD